MSKERVQICYRRLYADYQDTKTVLQNYVCDQHKHKFPLYQHDLDRLCITRSKAIELGITESILPTGGITEAYIPNTEYVYRSYCRPCDRFNRKIGRNVASGRLLKSLKV